MRRALAFLTPLGGAAVPSSEALAWFPAVGALVGMGVGGVWWLAQKGWGWALAAALAVGADLALTGMLHLDGLADSADGLIPHLERRRRLEIMAEPTVGAFAVGVVGATLLVRFGALADTRALPVAVAGLWCASRTVMALSVGIVPYARAQGMASAFMGQHRDGARTAGVVGVVLAGVLCFAGAHGRGELALVFLVLTMAAVIGFGWRRLGGFTGDVLGAAAVLGETAGLLVLAWH